MRTRILASIYLISIFAVAPIHAINVRDHRDPSTSGGAYALTATPIFEMTLTLNARQKTTCETRNHSAGADPILHLLAPTTLNGGVNEVARDDDSAGNLNSRFTYTATAAGKYRLIMIATSNSGGGTADIYCDNKPVWLKLPIGGAYKRLQSLRNKEVLLTVPLPGGPHAYVMYTIDDQQKILERYVTGPNESISTTVRTRPLQTMVVGSIWPDVAGPVRLIATTSLFPDMIPMETTWAASWKSKLARVRHQKILSGIGSVHAPSIFATPMAMEYPTMRSWWEGSSRLHINCCRVGAPIRGTKICSLKWTRLHRRLQALGRYL